MARIFDPDELHEIARQAIGLAPSEIHAFVAKRLERAHPGHVETRPNWVFNNAGGAMGQMTVMHGSLSEYIILFGTPIGTSGHSGRYRTEVWDFVIAGEMWCYEPGQMERLTYKPGDAAYLGRRKVRGYRVPDFAWMLEYGRGPIPTMLPFGMADSVFSTLDFTTFARSLWSYFRLVLAELRMGKL